MHKFFEFYRFKHTVPALLGTKQRLLLDPQMIQSGPVPHMDIERMRFFLCAIQDQGYVLSNDVMDYIFQLGESGAEAYLEMIVEELSTFTSTPMYPGFPKQVEGMSLKHLRHNASWHYFGDLIGARIFPRETFIKDQREAIDKGEYKEPLLISSASFGVVSDFMSSMLKSSSSWNAAQRRLVTAVVADGKIKFINKCANRENNAWLTSKDETLILGENDADYILRMIHAMQISDDDYVKEGNNLRVKKVKFNVSTSKRKKLYRMIHDFGLSNQDAMFASLLKNTSIWKTLFRHIHASAAPKKYWTLHIIAGMLYAGTNFPSIETYTDKMRKERDVMGLSKILTGGAFVRNIAFMLRHADGDTIKENYIIERMKVEIPKADGKVLFQALSALEHDMLNTSGKKAYYPVNGRVFVKKGFDFLPINLFTCSAIALINIELQNRFENKKWIGHVYVDEAQVNGLTIPLSERLSVQGTKNISRFSSLPLDDKNLGTIRAFLHWKDGEGRTDLDLSVAFFDSSEDYVSDISYTHMKNAYALHSGDITSAPRGASEYVDINIQAASNNGIRYAMVCCYAYSGQNLKDLPEASSGWMMRGDAQTGEIFDARTVENRFALNKNGYSLVSVIFDLKDKKAIWVDTPIAKSGTGDNVERTSDQLEEILFAGIHHNRPTMKLLLDSHIKTRGVLCKTKEAAEAVIDTSDESVLNLQDFDTVLAEYVN